MAKYHCEQCEEVEKQLEDNKGKGCRFCLYMDRSDKDGPCKKCFDTYTCFNHYPEFKER